MRNKFTQRQIAHANEMLDDSLDNIWDAIHQGPIQHAASTQAKAQPHYRARAISRIRKEIKDQFYLLAGSFMQYTTKHNSIPQLKEHFTNYAVQLLNLQEKLPELAWDFANFGLAESRDDMVQWSRDFDSYTQKNVVGIYFIKCLEAEKNSKSYFEFCIPASQVTSAIDSARHKAFLSAGGHDHFLCYSIALLFIQLHLQAFIAFIGKEPGDKEDGEGDFDLLTDGPYRQLLVPSQDLWGDKFAAHVRVLKSLPSACVNDYLKSIGEANYTMFQLVDNAARLVSATKADMVVAVKETNALRRQLSKLKDQNQSLTTDLTRTRTEVCSLRIPKAQEKVGAIDESRLNLLDQELRDTRQSLQRSEAATEDLRQELANVRVLLHAALAPASEVETKDTQAARLNPNDIKQKRLVFVGGHERLHAKLRKQLPNAILLHPDLSIVRSDVFESADAVIFNVGYCSHLLFWRAAQEARKRGIPSGYTNSTNVERVLSDIGQILSGTDYAETSEGTLNVRERDTGLSVCAPRGSSL